MDDLISRQAAIDAVEHITSSMSICLNKDECHGMKRMQRQAILELANMPSAQPEPCDLCFYLEKGDTLYQYSDWDGGIGFDYIRDIRYCPKCGRRLE